MPTAGKDKYNMTFRDTDSRLYELNRAGLDLTVLPAALPRIAKRTLDTANTYVVSSPDGTLISTYT